MSASTEMMQEMLMAAISPLLLLFGLNESKIVKTELESNDAGVRTTLKVVSG
jgi:hypothetical protein